MNEFVFGHEIGDELVIQFIALYALDQADEALSYTDLLNVIQFSCEVNYTNLQIGIDNLIKTEHIAVRELGDRLSIYSITEKGENVIEFFYEHIPLVVRENIERYIKDMFLEKRRREAVVAEIEPINQDEYRTECRLFDDDRRNLLTLSLYAGTREAAESMAARFRERPEDIYNKILEILDNRTG